MEPRKVKIPEYQIFAVDFDGTLSFGQWPEVGPENRVLFQFLKERKEKGDIIILWTCREGKCLADAVQWCEEHGLEFDAVNANVPERIAEYGVDSRKISCDYYIDDRAVSAQNFSDWRKQYVQQGIGEENVEFSHTGDFKGAFR